MLGVSLVAGWQAAKLPPSRFDPLGPGSFPLALAGILGLLSLAALALTLRGRDIGRAETAMVLGVDAGEGSHRRRPWLAVGTLAALVAYGLVLQFTAVGFFWATAVLIAGLGAAMSRRTPRQLAIAAAVGLAMSGLLTWLFGRVLLLSLP
jgi:putative tricarboxylic transport membrane protein